jgi:hypothetical protein
VLWVVSEVLELFAVLLGIVSIGYAVVDISNSNRLRVGCCQPINQRPDLLEISGMEQMETERASTSLL